MWKEMDRDIVSEEVKSIQMTVQSRSTLLIQSNNVVVQTPSNKVQDQPIGQAEMETQASEGRNWLPLLGSRGYYGPQMEIEIHPFFCHGCLVYLACTSFKAGVLSDGVRCDYIKC
ncbi:hypothetical protein Y1Q_0014689 [Alligator mississippiensis]|uniref:Uncharacterized protein n=1 Tax=Alligator mississippiensis TaxID=8496 RepID=A0A151P8D6_ALLMI|nr:hypothetical protein Y1Q_0014689 [Alligator mississippiensis]